MQASIASPSGQPQLSYELQKLLCRAIHPRYGIIREINEFPAPVNIPRFFTYMAPLTDTALSRKGAVPDYERAYKGGALECTYESCLWSAVCEALERYSAAIYDSDNLFRGTEADLPQVENFSERLIGYDPRTYKKKNFLCMPYDPKTTRTWVEGVDLTNGYKAYLPAQTVYFDYLFDDRSEFLTPSTTSGLAAGQDLEKASFSALCEVLERDAFMCTWLLKLPPPRAMAREFITDAWPPQLIELALDSDLEVCIYNLELDHGIPVVLASVYSPVLGARAFGASCKPTRDKAIQKALLEAVHSWCFVQNLRSFRSDPLKEREVVGFLDHAAYYAFRERQKKLEFLTNSPVQWRSTPEQREVPTLKSVAEHLKSLGYAALAFDLTSLDVRELDVSVARVVVPGMHPLYCGQQPIDGKTRLKEVHKRFGGGQPFQLNRNIHPFP